VVSLIAGFPAFVAWKNATVDFHFYLSRTFCVLLGLLLIFSVAYWSKRIKTMSFINTLTILFMSYLFVYLVGFTCGLYLYAHGTPHQLLLLEGQNPTISDAKLVLFTSHHVIVKTQSKISVFQTADVQEISSLGEPGSWLPFFPTP